MKTMDGKIKVLKTDLTNSKKQIQDLREQNQKKDSRILELENTQVLENKAQNVPMNELVKDLQTKIKKQKAQIDKLTYGYKDKTKFFVDKLASGISMLA